MNDLVNRLRLGPYHEPEGVEPENEEQVWNWWCEITDAAANHIEAQEKLIEELERRNRELNAELGGVRRSYFDERKKVITLSQSLQIQPQYPREER